MAPLMVAGLAAQGLSSLFGIGKGIQAMKQSRKINPQDLSGTFADQMLGQAQMALNARTPFAAAQQRGILGSQANAMAQAQRSVTDPSQILAMTAALQGGTDKALAEQGMQEQEAYQRSLSNLMNAQRFSYEDARNRFLMDQARKDALQQAGAQSVIGGLSNLAGTAISAQGLKNMSTPKLSKSGSASLFKMAAPAMSKSVLPFEEGYGPK